MIVNKVRSFLLSTSLLLASPLFSMQGTLDTDSMEIDTTSNKSKRKTSDEPNDSIDVSGIDKKIKVSTTIITLDKLPNGILLIRLLSDEFNPIITSMVCKKFRTINNYIIRDRWEKLKSTPAAFPITRTIKLLGLYELTSPKYNDFTKLYRSSIQQIGRSATKPKISGYTIDKDITSMPFNLTLNKNIQTLQDKNLIRIWPRINHEIIQITKQEPNTPVTNEEGNTIGQEKIITVEHIRSWLNRPENLDTIEQIHELDLSDLKLTCIPIELSIFVNLKILNLSDNCMTNLLELPKNLTQLKPRSIRSRYYHRDELIFF